MHVLSIVGHSDTGKTTLTERLTDRFSDRGRVGTVKHIDCEPTLDTEGKDTARHRAAGAVQTYGIGDDEWFATGDTSELDLHEALERLGERCDYALVEGYSDLALPTVVLGEYDVDRGEVLARPSHGEEADIEAIVDALEATEPYETLSSLVAKVKRSPDEVYSGAIATFTGRVRAKEGPDDERTEKLEFEKYDEVAEQKMAEIREELEKRDGVYEVRMHHKTGVVEAGEDIVFVVVLAGHRGEAFETVEDGINRLKEIVPLFKKEVTVDEEFWAHEQ
ncbi:molybdopterin synthase [Halovenus sp. WSH3]|uniref:Molybdopterin synthase n=1 Tax=Halovenus carboxidivorans TaxID=2692199 RepID=A0A6B0T6Z9_9EURY|nr:molybdopterin synthase [Halovenus carboxidivorans]MXR50971.1 molybdopterin synthase [Halovenus carboxidivorans]